MTFFWREVVQRGGEVKRQNKTKKPCCLLSALNHARFIKANGESPMLDICKPVPLTDKFSTCVLEWTANHPTLVKSVPAQVDGTGTRSLKHTTPSDTLTILSGILAASQDALLNFSKITLITV